MSLKTLFFKDTVIYGFTSYLGLLAAFFLTPIYTRILTKTDFGVMDLFNTWNNFFVLILPIGLTAAILRLHKDFAKDEELKKRYLGTLLVTLIGSCTAYVVLTILSVPILKAVYFKEGFSSHLLFLSMGIITFQVLIGYFQSMNRIEFRKYTYLTINLANFILLTTLGFILVYFYDYGVLGFFIAALTGSGFAFLIALVSGFSSVHFRFDFGIFKKAVGYSIFLLLVLVFLRFTYIVDRTLINNFLSLKEVGEYSIAMRLGNVMALVIGGFTTAWFPYAMSVIDKSNRDEIFQRAYKYYLLIFGTLAFCVNLFVFELLILIAPSYLGVETITYMIVSNSVLAGLAYFFGLGIHISKRSKFFIVSAVISFLLNLVVSISLVSMFGTVGIVFGSILGILCWVLIEYVISLKLEGIGFDLHKIVYLILFLASGAIIAYYLNHLSVGTYSRLLVKGTLLFAVLGVLTIFEKANIVSFFRESIGKSAQNT